MMTLTRGVRTEVGCLTMVPSSAWWAVPWTAPAPAWDREQVTTPTRGLLCSGRKEQQAVNLTEWKEQTPWSSSSLELGWKVWTLSSQTFVELLLVRLNRGWNCCGNDTPWQKYLWVYSCLKRKKLFNNQLVSLYKNMSRRVSYPSNILKLAGVIFAKRKL